MNSRYTLTDARAQGGYITNASHLAERSERTPCPDTLVAPLNLKWR